MVWILVDMFRPAIFYLALVYLFDESWMASMDVVIHPLRCSLAVVLRCRCLSTVRCGGEGLVLHGVSQVLKSVKDLLLGVDTPRTKCAATCPVWNDLLNKLVHSGTCLAGGTDYRLSVALCESAWCNRGGLSVALCPIAFAMGMGLSVALPEP
jgi:hypothetical protein